MGMVGKWKNVLGVAGLGSDVGRGEGLGLSWGVPQKDLRLATNWGLLGKETHGKG